MKKIFALILTVLFMFSSVSVFADAPSKWAEEEVNNALTAGYIPDAIQTEYISPITRGEFASLAVSFLKYELGYSAEEFINIVDADFGKVNFKDTADENILIAARLGIVYGYDDGSFLPDKHISREEAASMLARLYNLYGSIYLYSDIKFTDNDSISHWALSDVKFCVAKGIMKGVSDSLFEPGGVYTREQAIVTFNRLDGDTDWEQHNQNAKIRRKMSKELAERELLSNTNIITLIEKYETPYGTVYYTCMSGIMHARGYSLLLIDENGITYNLTEPVPSGKIYYYIPKINNISFYPEKTHFSFEVSFDTELKREDGSEIHKAGTYYFEANLVSKKTTLVNFIPKDNLSVLEQGIQSYLEEVKADKVIERFDTGAYGVVLYLKTGTPLLGDGDDRYILTLIGNDGKSHLLPCGPVLSLYGELPQISDITLSDYNSVISYKYVYTNDMISASPEVKEPGIYSCKVNLITLESEKSFIKTN